MDAAVKNNHSKMDNKKGIRNPEHYRRLMPKVVFRNAVELAFWGYVTAIKNVLPSVTLKEIVSNFRDDFGFSLDEFPEQSALKLWTRLQDEARKFKAEKKCLDPSLFETQSEAEVVKIQKEILSQISRINLRLKDKLNENRKDKKQPQQPPDTRKR